MVTTINPRLIEGVAIHPDHANPRLFYYGPLAPHLSADFDELTGQSVPKIQVIKYRGDAGNGGFLNFDVNLGVPEETLSRIARELRNQEDLDDDPILSPLPYVDGRVRMMLFGKQTPEEEGEPGDEDTAVEGQPEFVLKINQSSQPSLYGDNQASFSVQLDQAGVVILEEAIQGNLSPIGIVYELEYLALRPAFAARIHADWDRVYKHIDESFSASALFASVDIDKVVDELVEQQVIEIEIDNLLGDDNAGVVTGMESTVNELKNMVLNTCFKPSIDPLGQNEDGWDKAFELGERAVVLAATGGIGAKYQKLDLTRIDRKSINVELKQRVAVKRFIFPQAHLSGLTEILRSDEYDLDDFVLSVDLDSDWFKQRVVNVISRADYEQDAIESVSFTLNYEDEEPKGMSLTSANPRGVVEWGSVVRDDKMVDEVTGSFRVNFKGVNGSERPNMLESEEITVRTQSLELFPRELYSLTPISFMAINVPWDLYPKITVHVRYKDLANGINIKDSFQLDEEVSENTWKQFIIDPTKTEFEYQLTYHAADLDDKIIPWQPSNNELVVVGHPNQGIRPRVLSIRPAVMWSDMSMIYVDLWYEDKKNGIREEAIMEFDEENRRPKSFSFYPEDPNHRLIHYKVTMLFKGGSFVEIPVSSTNESAIFLRSDMMGRKTIRFQPEASTFAEKEITKITVHPRYEDKDSLLLFEDELPFYSPEDVDFFEFDYVDPNTTRFSFNVTYTYENGLSRTIEHPLTDQEEITVAIE